MRQIYDWVEGS